MDKRSNILVACHCKREHDPIYYSDVVMSKGYPTLKNKIPIGDIFNVDYIDTGECTKEEGQWQTWSDVPHSSKNFIFPYNCSLYIALLQALDWEETNLWRRMGLESTTVFTNLLEDGWNILKPGGSIVIPVSKNVVLMKQREMVEVDDGLTFQLDNLRVIVKHLSDKPWVVKKHDVSTLPFILGTDAEWKKIKNLAFLSIRKPKNGRRKTRKN